MTEAERERDRRHDDQMDRLTRVLHEMCGEVEDLRVLVGVVAGTLSGVYMARGAGISADECVRVGREASRRKP